MTVAVITGSAGLIGAEAARFFAAKGLDIIGIDNDMRAEFFGREASTLWSRKRLRTELTGYRHCDIDIRDQTAIVDLFARYKTNIGVIIHTATQPSHDWAAKAPVRRFFYQCHRHPQSVGGDAAALPGCVLYFYEHQQSLWRHAQAVATRRATLPLGITRRSPLRPIRHRRVDEHRPDHAQPFWERPRSLLTSWCKNTGAILG